MHSGFLLLVVFRFHLIRQEKRKKVPKKLHVKEFGYGWGQETAVFEIPIDAAYNDKLGIGNDLLSETKIFHLNGSFFYGWPERAPQAPSCLPAVGR